MDPRVKPAGDGEAKSTKSALEQMAVAFDLPLTDGKVKRLPFRRLVFDELIAQLLSKRCLHQGIGGKRRHRLLKRLRQEVDIAPAPRRFGDRIQVVFVWVAGIELFPYAFAAR